MIHRAVDRANTEAPGFRPPEEGSYDVIFAGARYQMTAHRTAAGRALKVYAHELGGSDFISFNAYRLSGEWTLKPCEMPLARVRAFLEGYQLLRE